MLCCMSGNKQAKTLFSEHLKGAMFAPGLVDLFSSQTPRPIS